MGFINCKLIWVAKLPKATRCRWYCHYLEAVIKKSINNYYNNKRFILQRADGIFSLRCVSKKFTESWNTIADKLSNEQVTLWRMNILFGTNKRQLCFNGKMWRTTADNVSHALMSRRFHKGSCSWQCRATWVEPTRDGLFYYIVASRGHAALP